MLCFLKERCGAYFVRLVLRAAFFPVYTVWIAFVVLLLWGQFVLHLSALIITFKVITFVGFIIDCKTTEKPIGYGVTSCRFPVVASELSLHSRGQNGWIMGAGGRANH